MFFWWTQGKATYNYYTIQHQSSTSTLLQHPVRPMAKARQDGRDVMGESAIGSGVTRSPKGRGRRAGSAMRAVVQPDSVVFGQEVV